VIVFVEDVARSLAFYVRVLGVRDLDGVFVHLTQA
jgi:catechol 2,3-dioxygenase-like lactoylglutathione lyase family enzyme